MTNGCSLTLISMRQDGFTPLTIFVLDFVNLTFIKNLQIFLEVKIDINWDKFDTLPSSLSLKKFAPRWR